MDFIFLGTSTANGYDSLGHFLRAEGVGTACLTYAIKPDSKCPRHLFNTRGVESAEGTTASAASLGPGKTVSSWRARSRSSTAPHPHRRSPNIPARRRQPKNSPAPVPPRLRYDGSAGRRLDRGHDLLLALRSLRRRRDAPQLPPGQMSATMNTHAPSFSVLLAAVAVLVLICPRRASPPKRAPPRRRRAASVTTAPAPPPEAPPTTTPTVEIRVPPPAPPRVTPQSADPRPALAGQHTGRQLNLGRGQAERRTPPTAPPVKMRAPRQPKRVQSACALAVGAHARPALCLAVGDRGCARLLHRKLPHPTVPMPIYQAAGTAYDIPWPVLAAINEVETDYGRDLSVSSAGAEGWMQFLPAEWSQYGVDANGDGFKDPYNPADAIFAAARYLSAAGGARNIRSAVFSYNHAQPYVDSVMLRAQLLGGTPPELLGAITALTEARFPVHAAAHFSDGFPVITPKGSSTTRTIPGTTIYSQAGAPVIAVQDGEVVRSGTRRRWVISSRCVTPSATPTPTLSSGTSRRSTRCSSRTFTARSAHGSASRAESRNRRRAVRRPPARSPARPSPKARPSRRSRSAPRPPLKLRPLRPRIPARRLCRPLRRAMCGSSGKAPTTSTCTRCAPACR